MSANFTPELNSYTDLTPFRYWCQKVLPLVYDDSLSYYELLCKVIDYLNKTMEDVNLAVEDVGKLYDAYETDKEEIENRLDALSNQINNPETGLWKAISDIHAVNLVQSTNIQALQKKAKFVTPEMFGAVGDGVTDDYLSVQAALDNDLPALLTGTYAIGTTLHINKDKTVICSANAVLFPAAWITHLIICGDEPSTNQNSSMPGLIKVIWQGGTIVCQRSGHGCDCAIEIQRLYHSYFRDISIIQCYATGMRWCGDYGALAIADNVVVKGQTTRPAQCGFQLSRNDQRLYNCSAIDCVKGYFLDRAYCQLTGCHVWISNADFYSGSIGYDVVSNSNGFFECTVDTVETGFYIHNAAKVITFTNIAWMINTNVVPDYTGMTMFKGSDENDFVAPSALVMGLQSSVNFIYPVALCEYINKQRFHIISSAIYNANSIPDYYETVLDLMPNCNESEGEYILKCTVDSAGVRTYFWENVPVANNLVGSAIVGTAIAG